MAKTEQFDFNQKIGSKKLEKFAIILSQMSNQIGFKVSSRGWCYLMEQGGYIDKSQFDKVESAINRCRKIGMLPVDFVAEEDARAFKGVEKPNIFFDRKNPKKHIKGVLDWMLRDVLEGDKYYTPDWWQNEEYYIQMLVEKIDLKTLFFPVCQEYHIPIANAKGWSSILQRAEYARRFKEAEDRGLKCVLLYCGDHDPDGLRISDTLRKNLYDVKNTFWSDGVQGYDPKNLTIERFGLNSNFIAVNNYTWIDNLVTGSGSELARYDENGNIVAGLKKGKNEGQKHQNFDLPYLQEYVKKFGVRKCEANAIVTTPEVARRLVRDEIEKWLGHDAHERFADRRFEIRMEYKTLLEETGLDQIIENIIDQDED